MITPTFAPDLTIQSMFERKEREARLYRYHRRQAKIARDAGNWDADREHQCVASEHQRLARNADARARRTIAAAKAWDAVWAPVFAEAEAADNREIMAGLAGLSRADLEAVLEVLSGRDGESAAVMTAIEEHLDARKD